MVSKQQPNNNGTSQVQTMIITSITLFALSGLILGLAVGAFTRPPKVQITTVVKHISITPTATHTVAPTPTPTLDITVVGIGCPKLNHYDATEMADGTTTYTVNAQIVDKSIDTTPPCGKGKELYAPDLTCKIWLSKDQDSIQHLSADNLKSIASLQAPFPKEEANSLLIDTGNQQVQPCSQTGATTWSYKLAPTVAPGNYFLAVVADWKGQRWNWQWGAIMVKAGKNN